MVKSTGHIDELLHVCPPPRKYAILSCSGLRCGGLGLPKEAFTMTCGRTVGSLYGSVQQRLTPPVCLTPLDQKVVQQPLLFKQKIPLSDWLEIANTPLNKIAWKKSNKKQQKKENKSCYVRKYNTHI